MSTAAAIDLSAAAAGARLGVLCSGRTGFPSASRSTPPHLFSPDGFGRFLGGGGSPRYCPVGCPCDGRERTPSGIPPLTVGYSFLLRQLTDHTRPRGGIASRPSSTFLAVTPDTRGRSLINEVLSRPLQPWMLDTRCARQGDRPLVEPPHRLPGACPAAQAGAARRALLRERIAGGAARQGRGATLGSDRDHIASRGGPRQPLVHAPLQRERPASHDPALRPLPQRPLEEVLPVLRERLPLAAVGSERAHAAQRE